jgi:VanZ family protein
MGFLKFLRRFSIILFWPALTVVIWGELTPHPPHEFAHIWDKALHFTAYFGLAGIATLALGPRQSLLYAVLALIALGGALEILQIFTGRDAEWLDEAANTLGAISGTTVGLAFLWLVGRGADD